VPPAALRKLASALFGLATLLIAVGWAPRLAVT
jgi:hypothetical protein